MPPLPTQSVSPHLLAANQRLLALREQVQNAKSRDVEQSASAADVLPWELAEPSPNPNITPELVSQLPAHLGWDCDAVTQAIQADLHRHERERVGNEHLKADHSSFRPISDGNHLDGQPSDSQSRATAEKRLPLPFNKSTIKHYPSIGIAALKEERAAIYRVWLMCRYLDQDGRGWLTVQDVREQLTDTDSKLRLFTWRRLRQVLGKGQGRFWIWDREHERLWLFGAARVATNLEATRLVGKPVALPISAITDSIGEFKAHLYAAWHSGRNKNNPISRAVQEMITSIPERTQRHYCQVARIRHKTNIAIGCKHNPEEVKKQAWLRGKATFHFIDHHGQHGQEGNSYVVWHLPNTYFGPHQQTPKGRMRKINRKLSDLVTKGTQGNRRQKVVKRYFVDGKDAVKALDRGEVMEAYWPLQIGVRPGKLWAVFS